MATTPVVYIHGIGSQDPAQRLLEEWDAALFPTGNKPRTTMAYWAHILHPLPTSHGIQALAKAAEISGRALSMAELVSACCDFAPSDAAAQSFAKNLTSAMMEQKQNLATVAARIGEGIGAPLVELPLISTLEPVREKLFEFLVKIFVADTAAYFYRGNIRDRMRETLITQLKAVGNECIIVAHSQGSIIAYDVLHLLGQVGMDLRVKMFVTLGSPLGMHNIRDEIRNPLEVPPNVEEWRNFADPWDPVAVNPQLKSIYNPSEKVSDTLVMNPQGQWGQPFTPHAVLGYLSLPAVRSLF